VSTAENKQQPAADAAPPPRPRGPQGPGPGGPGGHALVAPTAKAKDLRGSLRRLAGELKPERALLVTVVLLAVVSVAFAVVGPKILGHATNVIFEGVVSKQIPAGVTKAQAIAGLRAKGQGRIADMISGMTLDPGHGIDFNALARTLLLLVGVYVLSALFGWLQAYLMAGNAHAKMGNICPDALAAYRHVAKRRAEEITKWEQLTSGTNFD